MPELTGITSKMQPLHAKINRISVRSIKAKTGNNFSMKLWVLLRAQKSPTKQQKKTVQSAKQNYHQLSFYQKTIDRVTNISYYRNIPLLITYTRKATHHLNSPAALKWRPARFWRYCRAHAQTSVKTWSALATQPVRPALSACWYD